MVMIHIPRQELIQAPAARSSTRERAARSTTKRRAPPPPTGWASRFSPGMAITDVQQFRRSSYTVEAPFRHDTLRTHPSVANQKTPRQRSRTALTCYEVKVQRGRPMTRRSNDEYVELLDSGIPLWELPGIDGIAEDLRRPGAGRGVPEGSFEKLSTKYVRHRYPMFAKGSFKHRVLEVYEHESGLQIVGKRTSLVFGNVGVIRDLASHKRPGTVPAFTLKNHGRTYFELNLLPFGYCPHIHDSNLISPGIRQRIIDQAAHAFRFQESAWFIHGHLHWKNILMRLRADMEIADIAFIDFKKLVRRKLQRAADPIETTLEEIDSLFHGEVSFSTGTCHENFEFAKEVKEAKEVLPEVVDSAVSA